MLTHSLMNLKRSDARHYDFFPLATSHKIIKLMGSHRRWNSLCVYLRWSCIHSSIPFLSRAWKKRLLTFQTFEPGFQTSPPPKRLPTGTWKGGRSGRRSCQDTYLTCPENISREVSLLEYRLTDDSSFCIERFDRRHRKRRENFFHGSAWEHEQNMLALVLSNHNREIILVHCPHN